MPMNAPIMPIPIGTRVVSPEEIASWIGFTRAVVISNDIITPPNSIEKFKKSIQNEDNDKARKTSQKEKLDSHNLLQTRIYRV